LIPAAADRRGNGPDPGEAERFEPFDQERYFTCETGIFLHRYK
jgi:hypothetical protein